MDLIHFEKQEGMLCAQHALNALLQGAYFTVLDLAQIAQTLDEKEGAFMAEAGTQSAEYKRFMEEGSQNMDDSGFFSVQVMSDALSVWNVDLVNIKSTTDSLAVAAQMDPTEFKAYICNFRQHWFTIRKFGSQWFNLNSVNSGPELISNTYLGILLKQLESDGYTIFVVRGGLPQCAADDALRNNPVDPAIAALMTKINKASESGGGASSPRRAGTSAGGSQMDGLDPDVAEALKISEEELDSEEPTLKRLLSETRHRRDAEEESALQAVLEESLMHQEDNELEKALALSMQQDDWGSLPSTNKSAHSSCLPSASAADARATAVPDGPNISELHIGNHMAPSISQTNASALLTDLEATPHPDEVRRKREAFLNRLLPAEPKEPRVDSHAGSDSKQDGNR